MNDKTFFINLTKDHFKYLYISDSKINVQSRVYNENIYYFEAYDYHLTYIFL